MITLAWCFGGIALAAFGVAALEAYGDWRAGRRRRLDMQRHRPRPDPRNVLEFRRADVRRKVAR